MFAIRMAQVATQARQLHHVTPLDARRIHVSEARKGAEWLYRLEVHAVGCATPYRLALRLEERVDPATIAAALRASLA